MKIGEAVCHQVWSPLGLVRHVLPDPTGGSEQVYPSGLESAMAGEKRVSKTRWAVLATVVAAMAAGAIIGLVVEGAAEAAPKGDRGTSGRLVELGTHAVAAVNQPGDSVLLSVGDVSDCGQLNAMARSDSTRPFILEFLLGPDDSTPSRLTLPPGNECSTAYSHIHGKPITRHYLLLWK